MATGQPGRGYCVELWDVQTFHARRRGFSSRQASAVALELGPDAELSLVVRTELVGLLIDLQAEHGAGVGFNLTPFRWLDLNEAEYVEIWRQAAALAGCSLYCASPKDPVAFPGIAVHPSVLTSDGELQGTTAQAAR